MEVMLGGKWWCRDVVRLSEFIPKNAKVGISLLTSCNRLATSRYQNAFA